MSTYNHTYFPTSQFNGTSSATSLTQGLSIGNQIYITADGYMHVDGESMRVVELLQVANIMKQMILDISRDEEVVSKYPYIKEAAHTWFMQTLKK
jgi:hypothetical protein